MTLATASVLRVLLEEPTKPRYGFDIAREAGLATGSLYPILARLEQSGWLDSCWEQQGADNNPGRPRRRYYTLTGEGVISARNALSETQRRIGPRQSRSALGSA